MRRRWAGDGDSAAGGHKSPGGLASPTLLALSVAAVLTACPACSAVDSPTGSQPIVSIGGTSFTVEVRDTAQGRAQGLSGRAEVPPGTGMLFRYDDDAPRGYWMSGMLLPIDLAWITDGKVVAVETLQPCAAGQPCPIHDSPGPVDAVLEVAAGALSQVEPGAAVVIEIP
jgi:hypothetical protein